MRSENTRHQQIGSRPTSELQRPTHPGGGTLRRCTLGKRRGEVNRATWPHPPSPHHLITRHTQVDALTWVGQPGAIASLGGCHRDDADSSVPYVRMAPPQPARATERDPGPTAASRATAGLHFPTGEGRPAATAYTQRHRSAALEPEVEHDEALVNEQVQVARVSAVAGPSSGKNPRPIGAGHH